MNNLARLTTHLGVLGNFSLHALSLVTATEARFHRHTPEKKCSIIHIRKVKLFFDTRRRANMCSECEAMQKSWNVENKQENTLFCPFCVMLGRIYTFFLHLHGKRDETMAKFKIPTPYQCCAACECCGFVDLLLYVNFFLLCTIDTQACRCGKVGVSVLRPLFKVLIREILFTI